MNIGDLKALIQDLPDEMEVITTITCPNCEEGGYDNVVVAVINIAVYSPGEGPDALELILDDF